ncbi:Translation initiation factor 2 OS=Ureibacillus acetophenoni OX=614649 GN=SAMN05877842_102400 PE=4 SV=1 [Ureibacillus acetophenoni]
MKNNEINKFNGNENPESQAAQLAVIAGLITTLGDGLATIASILALKESQQNQNNSSNNYDLKLMQKQIDELTKDVKIIKKKLSI